MKTVVLGAKEVANLLSMKECITVMDKTFREMARGEATFPPRNAIPQPNKKGVLGLMPGSLSSTGIFGLKATSVFPGNLGTPYESHQGAILLFESEHGSLVALVEAGSVTRIRTAAVSGVATDALAREDSEVLALLGSGTQASSHLDAMLTVRPRTRRVLVNSRTLEHAEQFARRAQKKGGPEVIVADTAKKAVEEADIICTTTAASTPVLFGAWLRPGTHINAVGASRPPNRELDTEAVARSRFFVDSRQSAMLEADDFRIPKQEGRIDDGFIVGEIGEVLEGRVSGRTNEKDITIFKSLGLAIEDLAAAYFVYNKSLASEPKAGAEFGAERDA